MNVKTRFRCYNCGEVGHLSRDCKEPRKESGGRSKGPGGPSAKAQTIGSQPVDVNDPMSYLYPDPGVRQVRVKDGGSLRHYARVAIQGVEARGLVDTGADITIMGGELFKKVALEVRLLQTPLKPPDRTPLTYDVKLF